MLETERRTSAAVCLLVDQSYSMLLRETWGMAKATALALHSLVSTRYPQDALEIIGFSLLARTVRPADLPDLDAAVGQGTNLHHALVLAGRHLDRHPEAEPVVLVVTDGEPTAHLEPDGYPIFDYPPDPRTIELTLTEVTRLTRRRRHHQRVHARRRPAPGRLRRPDRPPQRRPRVRPLARPPGRLRGQRLPPRPPGPPLTGHGRGA